MKLDRNTNRDGRGKYALVNMRKMVPLLDRSFDRSVPDDVRDELAVAAFNLLVSKGIITLGNETPGDQFFVMKYKDRFTASGLRGYAKDVAEVAVARQDSELKEFAQQMFTEAELASRLGTRIPD